MGNKLDKYKFKPKESEQLYTVLKVCEEKRAIIHGVVIDSKGNMIHDAVVKLYEIEDDQSLIPLSHIFTDDWGQFLFGPIDPNKNYLVKVWYNKVKIKQVIVDTDCFDEDVEEEMDVYTEIEKLEFPLKDPMKK